jgi:hypothetical protein
MLTGQLSSAPKSRAPCLVNIAPPISGGSAIGLSATGSPGQAPPADDVSACAQIRTIFKRAILHLRIGIAGQHLGITCSSARRLVAGRGFELQPHNHASTSVPRHLAAGRIFVRTRWNGCYFTAFDSQIAQLRLTRLPDLQPRFKNCTPARPRRT